MEKQKLKLIAKSINRGVNLLEDTTDAKISYYEVKIANFVGNSVQLHEEDIQHDGRYSQISSKQLERGDILMPLRRGPGNDNKIAIYDLDMDVPVIVSHHIFVIRPKQNIVTSYFLLFYFLHISEVMNADKLNVLNNGSVAISTKYLQELEIPVPSLEKQQKCEEYFKTSQEIYELSTDLNTYHKRYYQNIVTLIENELHFVDTEMLENTIMKLDTYRERFHGFLRETNRRFSKYIEYR
ncbi:MAG: restriction endonuclease subunit S [Sulfuricurvum sp.]|nr:restriction endonuclease subunit S [Sulfuricurvum sp.]